MNKFLLYCHPTRTASIERSSFLLRLLYVYFAWVTKDNSQALPKAERLRYDIFMRSVGSKLKKGRERKKDEEDNMKI